MSKDIVDVLIERRLIRPEGGGQRVRLELSHDVLLDPVVGARQMREGREREAAAWRKTFWLFFAMGIAAVVGFGLYQRNRAIEARNALEAAELLKQSDALASSPLSLDRSYLLAIRALRMSPSADAVQRVKDIGRASDDSLPPPLVRLSRPGGPVRSIAVNKPGTHLATRSTTHEACLWALRSGQLVATLRHDGRVNAVGFSIDGSQLATGGADGRVKLWTLAGQETASLREGSPINSIAFAPARARLAVTADSGRVGVWDISTPSRPREVASVRHEAAAHLVAFNQDASLLASAGDDGIRLWRIEPTGAMKAVGRVPQRTTPRTLQFVTLDHELFPRDRWAGWPQSEVLLVTDLGAAAHVWGVPRQGVAEPREWPSQVYFLGAPLLMAGDTGDLLDVLKEAEERRLRLGAAPPGAAGDAAISLFWSGRDLWALDSNGVARKWMGDAALSVRTTSRIRALTTTLVQPERVPLTAAAAYESGSRYIVTGNALGTTLVWAPEERRLGQWAIATVSANGARAAGLDRGAFSADPFPIVPPRRRNPRSLWSYLVWRDSPFDSPDRPFPEPPRLNDGTLAFNLSDDGSILAVATNDGGAIWRFAQGNSGRFTHFTREEKRRSGLDRGFEPYQAIHVEVGAQTLLIATGASIELRSVSDGHLLWSKSIARLQGARLSPNGGEVAVWTPDRVMLVKGSDAEQPFGVTGRVRTASFDPAGKRLAVCVDSGTAALFDVSTGGWLRSFDVGSPCQTIAFDHSGARLAVGAQNGIAHVFDENASKAGTPLPMNAPVSALAFSSDGAALVAGSDDHVVHVWDLQTAKELARTTAAGDIIEQVGFSQDATRVFALGPFGLVSEVWQSRDVLAEACAAVRGRSRDSRRRYLADEQDVLAACPSTF